MIKTPYFRCFFNYLIKKTAYNGIDLIFVVGLYPNSFVLTRIEYLGLYLLL